MEVGTTLHSGTSISLISFIFTYFTFSCTKQQAGVKIKHNTGNILIFGHVFYFLNVFFGNYYSIVFTYVCDIELLWSAGSYGRLYVGSMSLAMARQPVLIKTVTGLSTFYRE